MLISFWLFFVCMDQFSLLLHRRRRNLRPWLHCTGYPYSASTSTNNQYVTALTGGGGTDSVRLHMSMTACFSVAWIGDLRLHLCHDERLYLALRVNGLAQWWPRWYTYNCTQPTSDYSRQQRRTAAHNRWLLLCRDNDDCSCALMGILSWSLSHRFVYAHALARIIIRQTTHVLKKVF